MGKPYINRELAEKVNKAFLTGKADEKLTIDQVDILTRRFVLRKGLAMIGQELGISVNAVQHRIMCALDSLEDPLRKKEPAEQLKPMTDSKPTWKTNNCRKCRYWRPLSSNPHLKACHYCIDNEHSRPRKGDKCQAFEPKETGRMIDNGTD